MTRPVHPYHRGVRARNCQRRYVVLGCGSRQWRDSAAIHERLSRYPPGTLVIHGDQASWDPEQQCWYGADHLVGLAAIALGFDVLPVPYFSEYGRSGGPIRNGFMLSALKLFRDGTGKHAIYSCHVEAFHMGGPGTQDMINRARRADFHVHERRPRPEDSHA